MSYSWIKGGWVGKTEIWSLMEQKYIPSIECPLQLDIKWSQSEIWAGLEDWFWCDWWIREIEGCHSFGRISGFRDHLVVAQAGEQRRLCSNKHLTFQPIDFSGCVNATTMRWTEASHLPIHGNHEFHQLLQTGSRRPESRHLERPDLLQCSPTSRAIDWSIQWESILI